MNTQGLSAPYLHYRLPFYTNSRAIESLADEWFNGPALSLIRHDVECTFWLQVRYQCPPVVVIGADKTLLLNHVISRVAAAKDRPLIVALTESSDEWVLSECYDQGADRVIAIPHCTARILNALLRSLLPKTSTHYPPYLLSAATQSIKFAEREVRLTKTAFDVAHYLFTNHGQLIPKNTILKEVWGIDSERCVTRRVETQISNLRNKLLLNGSYGWEIRMRRSKGYGLFSCSPGASAKPNSETDNAMVGDTATDPALSDLTS